MPETEPLTLVTFSPKSQWGISNNLHTVITCAAKSLHCPFPHVQGQDPRVRKSWGPGSCSFSKQNECEIPRHTLEAEITCQMALMRAFPPHADSVAVLGSRGIACWGLLRGESHDGSPAHTISTPPSSPETGPDRDLSISRFPVMRPWETFLASARLSFWNSMMGRVYHVCHRMAWRIRWFNTSEAAHSSAVFALHHALYPVVHSSAMAYRCKTVFIGNFPEYVHCMLFSYHHWP